MLTPRNDRVIVKPILEERSPAGLYIPENAQKPQIGEVVGIGPGGVDMMGQRHSIEGLALGDKVLYAKYAGVTITDDGETLIVLKEADILAVDR